MDDLASKLAAFAAPFSQDSRLFSLRFTDSRFDAELLPLALAGEEQLSQTFRIDVDCLSSDATLELKQLLGLGLDIAIRLNDGSERRLAGLITRAEQRGADGGFAHYRLVVEPALALLQLRHNSRLFQERSVVDIVALLLDEQIAINPAFAHNFRYRSELTQSYPVRSFCQQYRESDLAFIERLLSEEGISYRFDFAQQESAVGLHTLVLFDADSAPPPALQQQVRFHRADASETEDSLTHWSSERSMHSGSVALTSFDYKTAALQQGSDHSAVDQHDGGAELASTLEDYDSQTLYYIGNDADQHRYATLRQRALDLQSKQFSGEGAVRGLAAGHWFALDDHPNHNSGDDNQFIVLRHQFVARNNLPADSATPNQLTADEAAAPPLTLAEPGFRNRIDAVRKTVPITPPYAHTRHAKPTARGIQTATVVGPAGEEIFTDALGRIKVQFHWARSADHDPNRHGASADKNDFSSCWIRVGYPSAGANYGHQFIPRVGQEVAVSFLENDIDRPIVCGVIHNGRHQPPTFNSAGTLPANKTLSGIKSREYKGSRHNELLFDDTPGEIRAQLSSEHGKSQLTQGFLIHPRRQGKGDPRGEGFELRSDNAGAVRAAQGLLITTEPQANAGASQLTRATTLQTLDAACQQADQLGAAARAQQANQPETGKGQQGIDGDWQRSAARAHGHLHHLREAAHNLERNSNSDREGKSGQGTQAGQQALLLLSGQQGLTATTPQSCAITSGHNFDQIALRDHLQTSGRRWIGNAAESISLFVAGVGSKLKESFKLIAANGDIQMQAQESTIEIDGDQSLSVTACSDSIIARANKAIVLHCAGAQIRLSDGNITVTAPGTLSLKGAQQSATGPISFNTQMPILPSHLDEKTWIEVQLLNDDGSPAANQPYEIRLPRGETASGLLDENGIARIESTYHGKSSVSFPLNKK